MKTIRRPNPPAYGWTEIQVEIQVRGFKTEVEISFTGARGRVLTSSLSMPIETARELAQAILEGDTMSEGLRPCWFVIREGDTDYAPVYYSNVKADAEKAAVDIARRYIGTSVLLFELVGECKIELAPPQWERGKETS